MIDSLIELRGELGAASGLCMVMGCDALLGITDWHHWQELLDWAHIVIIARPGWDLPRTGEVAHWLREHRLDDRSELQQRPAGGIVIEELRPLAISATEIRQMLRAGQSARYLLPQSVLDYIQAHQLYA
jgi:nicotinate-nucleotide adenylyltransferase